MDEDPLTTVGRITLAMLGIGIGIALVAFLTGQWISATVVPGLGAAEEQVVVSYTPLAFLSITALSAPIVAGFLGISESTRSTATRHAAVVAVACLVGASLMVMIAGLGIAFAEPAPPDTVDDDSGDNGGEMTQNDSENGDNSSANGENESENGDNSSANGDNSSASGDNETDGNESDGGDDGGDSGGDPGPLDLVGLAGLCGVGSLISGGMTTKFGA
jgi:hypothetical protein